MELIKREDSEYEEYENLLIERDQLEKDAASIWITYVQTFGTLITAVYEEKIECIKCKKTIGYYQNALNHGGVIDPEALQSFMDQEMAVYYQNLKKMQTENEACGKAKQSSAYEVKRAKELYRRLAKHLHPDINPETDRNDSLKDLWQRILIAYGHNNVKDLSELEVLVRKALKELGAAEIRVEIPDIEIKIEEIKEEIKDLISNEPYVHKTLLEDEDAVQNRKAELSQELEEYRKYHKELEDVIENMLQEGGLTIKWKLN